MSRRERPRKISAVLAVHANLSNYLLDKPDHHAQLHHITHVHHFTPTAHFIYALCPTPSHTLFPLIPPFSYHHADCERLASEHGSHVAFLLVEALGCG